MGVSVGSVNTVEPEGTVVSSSKEIGVSSLGLPVFPSNENDVRGSMDGDDVLLKEDGPAVVTGLLVGFFVGLDDGPTVVDLLGVFVGLEDGLGVLSVGFGLDDGLLVVAFGRSDG